MDLNKFTDQELWDRWKQATDLERDLRTEVQHRGFEIRAVQTGNCVGVPATPRVHFYATKTETQVTRLD